MSILLKHMFYIRYKLEYKAIPCFLSEKINKQTLSTTKVNMSVSFEGCKQKEVKIILPRNSTFKI
jgi:hypothetical protein